MSNRDQKTVSVLVKSDLVLKLVRNPMRGKGPYVAFEGVKGFYRNEGFPHEWTQSMCDAAKAMWDAYKCESPVRIEDNELKSFGQAIELRSEEQVDAMIVALCRFKFGANHE